MINQSSPGLTFPAPLPPSSQWDGLNVLLTRQRLSALEAAVAQGNALITQACWAVITDADSVKDQQPNPIKGDLNVPGFYTAERTTQQAIVAQLRCDAQAAFALAWGYALTGNADYAAAAKRFLIAWVRNLTKPVDGLGQTGAAGIAQLIFGEGGGDTALIMHYTFPHFLYAYDILNGFGQFQTAEKEEFKLWLAPFIDYHFSEESFVNNHQNWQVLFMGAAAHVTEDRALMDKAVGYYRNGMRRQQIAADGCMWRELARGPKAATYTLMALEAMVQFVTIAEHHGVTDLRDLVAGARETDSPDDLMIATLVFANVLRSGSAVTGTGVAKDGGTLLDAFNSLRDFMNANPAAGNNFQPVIGSPTVNGPPVSPSDWGWIFEVGNAWFPDQSFTSFLQEAPYGLTPVRAYTLSYATQLFRPL